MGVFIGGVVTVVLIALAALLLIFIGLIVADDGFVDMPPDPTCDPAGWGGNDARGETDDR